MLDREDITTAITDAFGRICLAFLVFSIIVAALGACAIRIGAWLEGA